MEGAPLTPEDDKDAGKKKKRAESLGTIFSGESSKVKKEDTKGLWEQLIGSKEKIKPETTDQPETAESVKIQEVSEAEAPLDQLAEAEKQHVEAEIVQAQPAAEALPADNPLEIAEAQAVASFRDKIVTEGKPAEQAFAETLDELAVSEAPATEPAAGQPESEPAAIDPETPNEFSEEPVRIERTVEAPLAKESDPDDDNAASQQSSGAGDGGTPPPSDGPPGSGSPDRPNRPPEPLPVEAVNPNLTATDTERSEYTPDYDEGNPAAMALLGGIIGYLIGRRRGRIKTEKKLLPVQKKLEKQVKALQEDIVSKERRIRQTARQQAYELGQFEKITRHRESVPESEPLPDKVLPPERIGQVLVEAEKSQPVDKLATDRVLDKSAERMSRVELLGMSEKIIIDGSSLREIYETSLVGEKGLRRLVGEHLRGANIRKALKREILERKIDFERDPALRDQAAVAASAGGTEVTLDALLQKADVSLSGDKEEVAFLKARAAHAAEQQAQQHNHRRVMDAAMVGTIAVLIAIVAILVITRS